MYPCVTRSHVVRMFLVGTRMYPCVTRMLPVRYPHVPEWCFSLRFVSYNCSGFDLGLNLPNVRSSKTGLNSYPDSEFLLPWVPEFFLARGGNFRCWAKADTSSAVGRSRDKNFHFSRGKLWRQKRKEKPLAPRVGSFFSGTCLPDSNDIHKQFYRTNYDYYHYNVTGRICGTLYQKI